MKKNYSRRELIRMLGGTAGAVVTLEGCGPTQRISLPDRSEMVAPPKAVTAITLGAGNRGNTYGNYASKFPEQLNIVGVAEPISIRNKKYCEQHGISSENSVVTWEHIFDRPKFADAVIITTPDHLHYGPCMAALKKGYDILLEKPISPSERECKDILELANKTGRIVAVCHVLRYAPYFIALRQLVHDGSIGELISVQHFEPIEHVHMAHSFVRGNWHNSKECNPIILAKSCHDLDILRWIVDKPCKKVSAFGGLEWFHSGNKPEGAKYRCMDGCAIESACPYSALKIYYRDRQRTYVFDLPDNKEEHGEAILQYLKETNYGRCVYDMENDQPDHYVMNMEFKGGITAAFNMEAFTSYHGRRTRIMGSHGDIVGDMSSFVFTNFLTGEKTEWSMSTDGHGGGDWKLVADWIQAVSAQDASLLTSSIEASIDSHMMGFAAEKSREAGIIVNLE